MKNYFDLDNLSNLLDGSVISVSLFILRPVWKVCLLNQTSTITDKQKKKIVMLKCLLSNVWFVFVSRKKSESCWTTPATVYLHLSGLCAGGSLQKWRINWWSSYNRLTLLEQFVLNYMSASHVCRWWRDVMFNCSCACGLVFTWNKVVLFFSQTCADVLLLVHETFYAEQLITVLFEVFREPTLTD